MKRTFKLSVIASLVLGSCLVNAAEITAKTNDRVLENTIDALSISSVVRPVVKNGATIAIRNIESETTTDKKIVSLIEDQLVIDLMSNGYTVLERDNNAIRRVMEEGGRGNFSIIRGEMAYLDPSKLIEGNDKLIKEPTLVEDNKKNLLLTHLKSADYILSYRIQELGINYDELDSKNVKRNSVARLHIRIEEATTGKILLAKNIESTAKDTVPNDQVKTLAFSRRSQFYQAYPGQNPNEDNIYMLSDKHAYVQMALLNTFTDQTGGFGIKSPIQIGLLYGDEHIAYETMNGQTEHNGVPLDQEASMLVYGRKVGKLALGSINASVVPEFGIGNARITNWDTNSGRAEKKNVGLKLGIGLEALVIQQIDVRLGADIYIVENNYLAVGSMALRYRF